MNQNQFEYQAWLQGVANQLGNEFVDILDETDPEILRIVTDAWRTSRPTTPQQYDRWINGIRRRIVAIRGQAIVESTRMIVGRSEEIAAHATSETAQEITELTRRTEEAIRSHSTVAQLTPEQLDDVIQYAPFDGRTIREWLTNYENDDLARIMQGIQQGFTSGHTLQSMIRMIRGTQENSFADGVLSTSRNSARMIARTITNGVSNSTRLQTYQENADVIDGVRFSAAFDSRTCLLCGVEDRKIWKTNELDRVHVPPLHPNCRCAIVPYIDLGEEFAGERAVEVRDFEKDAKDAHDANPNATKKWSELSYDTRRNLRYKAMRDYETVHGKGSAYRRVSADQSFKDIFDTQPAQFQRSWLGKTRYEAYKAGKLTLDQMVTPDTGYVRTVKDLGISDATGKSTAEKEAERKRKEEEEKRRIEQEKKRLEEERRKLEEEKQRLEEEAKKQEEERKRREQIEKRQTKETVQKKTEKIDDEAAFKAAFGNADEHGRNFVRIHRVRDKLKWSRERFDKTLEKLRADGHIQLMPGDASSLTKQNIEDSYFDNDLRTTYITLRWLKEEPLDEEEENKEEEETERKRREEEERKKQKEEERKRKEEEKKWRQKEEAERQRREEEKRKAEEELKRQKEETKRIKEENKRLKEELRKIQKEEKKKRKEEEAKSEKQITTAKGYLDECVKNKLITKKRAAELKKIAKDANEASIRLESGDYKPEEKMELMFKDDQILIQNEGGKEHQKIETLFPDRGYDPVFSDEDSSNLIHEIEKNHSKEKVESAKRGIEEAFEFWNTIARSIGFDGSKKPRIVYEEYPGTKIKAAGFYERSENKVAICQSGVSDTKRAMIHEIGHWFESKVAGSVWEVEKWIEDHAIKDKKGNYTIEKSDKDQIDRYKTKHNRIVINDYAKSKYTPEAFSVGIETLAESPIKMATFTTEHFEFTIKILMNGAKGK